jgi:predicted nucleotidyltransferase
MAGANHGEPPVKGVDVAAIRRYLAATDVRFAILFGSRVRGDAHESSDVDVALRFPDDLSPTSGSADGTGSTRSFRATRTPSLT